MEKCYECLGKDQLKEIDNLYREKCEEVARLEKENKKLREKLDEQKLLDYILGCNT